MHLAPFSSPIRLLGLTLLLAALPWVTNSRGQITDPYSPTVQNDLGPGEAAWVQRPDGWYYTGITNDGDPTDPNEANEGEELNLGPFPAPNNSLVGVNASLGDYGAIGSQPFTTKLTSGGPIDLATLAETFSHTLLSLSGARTLEFTISYNSQITGGNQYITPAGRSHDWTLYTPGDIGHWTHNFEGQATFVAGTGGAANKVILLVAHRRWTFVQNGSSYQHFDQSSPYDSLILHANGVITLRTKDQSTYAFSGPGLYLTKVTNPHGQAIVIARNGSGHITTITEPASGKSLSFTYGTTGHSAGRITPSPTQPVGAYRWLTTATACSPELPKRTEAPLPLPTILVVICSRKRTPMEIS